VLVFAYPMRTDVNSLITPIVGYVGIESHLVSEVKKKASPIL